MSESISHREDYRGPSHATVFVWLFAVSAIWHYTSSASDIMAYWFRYDPLVTPLVFLSVVSAFIAACYPSKTLALMVMCLGQLITIFLRFPFVADHIVMELFLNLSIAVSFLALAVRQRRLNVPLDDLFALFSPIGRWLLVIMYFYGTFHKLNPGFMSVESSCAAPFIGGFPVLRDLLGYGWLEYVAIYGTLIMESIAMLLLLSTRTKYLGMMIGISFHLVIGISGYGTLAHFSAFAIALHALFLPSTFGQRVIDEPLIPSALKSAATFRVLTVFVVVTQVVFALHMATTREGFLVNSLFAVFAVSLMYLVIKYGQIREGDLRYRLRSPLVVLHVIPVWFFLHCASPYIGLGTGGTIAMFSGLRTEGGQSNHYLIREPIPLFHYQDRVLYVEESANPNLQEIAKEGQGMVMFDFQRHFSYRDTLLLPLTLNVDGKVYRLQDGDDLTAFMNEHFTQQSWLERKYMSFRLVDDLLPERCRH
ncbi:MAG: hypothetical protein ACR2QZ_09140 [Woeseiaceae bacterium]